MTRIICIYLPQFHAIPENNKWWGEGFTEWTNVKRGRSFYPGHYQPRIPLSGYYDLSNIHVLEEHARLASTSGIYGFAFYHYYYVGKKLLEKPIEEYRDKSNEKFPYCLIWANQSWERTWYRARLGHEMLLEQTYGKEKEWKQQFEYLKSFFHDDRYIKIDNKPVYAMYLPQDIHCKEEVFSLWHDLAIKEGWDGLYLIAMKTGAGMDRQSDLYSAYMNFEPMHIIREMDVLQKDMQSWKYMKMDKVRADKKSILNYVYSQNAYSYELLCREIEKGKRDYTGKKTFLGVFSGWDNTPRKDEEGIIVRKSTPGRFRKNLKKMMVLSEKMGNEFLFLNAWNEWSEGAYVEPDYRYKTRYLDAINDVTKQSTKG